MPVVFWYITGCMVETVWFGSFFVFFFFASLILRLCTRLVRHLVMKGSIILSPSPPGLESLTDHRPSFLPPLSHAFAGFEV